MKRYPSIWGLAIFPCWLLADSPVPSPLDWSGDSPVSYFERLSFDFSDADSALEPDEGVIPSTDLIRFGDEKHESGEAHFEFEGIGTGFEPVEQTGQLFEGGFSAGLELDEGRVESAAEPKAIDLGLSGSGIDGVLQVGGAGEGNFLSSMSSGNPEYIGLESTGDNGFLNDFDHNSFPSLTTVMVCFFLLGFVAWNSRA
ncbi:MAG: hypothetical protein ACSHYF_03835 [Verrucomicrobiaceae bacterium]